MLGAGAYLAKKVLTPDERPESKVRVTAIDPSPDSPTGLRVWLRGPDIDLEGSYSFIFDTTSRWSQQHAGHARVGPVVATRQTSAASEVAREVLSVERGDLREGAAGRITGWWFTEPEQLGYDVRLVSLPMPDGVSWGWLISPEKAKEGRWAVHVHGRGSLPHETLRGVKPFAEAGITSLVIAYRNDLGAPAGRRGRYGLGLAEQLDVDAAVGWARKQGAKRVTLVGWSMGAAATVLAAANGENAEVIDGLVLDSPALDWPSILRNHARLSYAPAFVADVSIAMLQSGIIRGAVPGHSHTDMSALTSHRLISSIRVPTLIHAGPGDTYVPWIGSLRAAQLKPSLVRLHQSRGEHVKHWNVNPEAWEAETAAFIERLGDPRPDSRD